MSEAEKTHKSMKRKTVPDASDRELSSETQLYEEEIEKINKTIEKLEMSQTGKDSDESLQSNKGKNNDDNIENENKHVIREQGATGYQPSFHLQPDLIGFNRHLQKGIDNQGQIREETEDTVSPLSRSPVHTSYLRRESCPSPRGRPSRGRWPDAEPSSPRKTPTIQGRSKRSNSLPIPDRQVLGIGEAIGAVAISKPELVLNQFRSISYKRPRGGSLAENMCTDLEAILEENISMKTKKAPRRFSTPALETRAKSINKNYLN